jgi:tellurite resistance protein TerC
VGTPILWAGFLVGVLAVISVDLLLSRGEAVTPRKAAAWTGVWVFLSLAFAGLLHSLGGTKASVPFLTAYVIEYALSVDNLFVFLVIFSYFKVPSAAQHRLLYWGILGAFVLRGVLIFLGTSLVAEFEWILYFFGAFLLWTAWKLLFSSEDDDVDPEANKVLKLARRVLRVTDGPRGLAFVVREEGKLFFTPLFLVLLVVETSDLLFALDSIPAVLGISKDSFLVFSSNACAILGLRSLFFLVSSLMDKFRYLKTALGIVLAFVGVKLPLETAFHSVVLEHEGLVIVGSLAFIGLTLGVAILLSVVIKPPRAEPDAQADASKSPAKSEP